jgi:class 3 adenylate cyclase
MSRDPASVEITYARPAGATSDSPCLVYRPGGRDEQRYHFVDRVAIGRHLPGRDPEPGALRLHDATISRRHCVLTHRPDGGFLIRDLSTNGTWVAGRRLVPNIETRVGPGQVIGLGNGVELTLEYRSSPPSLAPESEAHDRTIKVAGWSEVTVLVGDIRSYTSYVRQAPADRLQQSVNRVFSRIEGAVAQHGGTVKEYPGDAVFAFWDQKADCDHVRSACRAALEIHRLVEQLAGDREIWSLPEFPLRMEWALASGRVVIESIGESLRTGLSIVGEPVVLAFRLEKLADQETGPIIACGRTQEIVADAFEFRPLGKLSAKGFERIDDAYALMGVRQRDRAREGSRPPCS